MDFTNYNLQYDQPNLKIYIHMFINKTVRVHVYTITHIQYPRTPTVQDHGTDPETDQNQEFDHYLRTTEHFKIPDFLLNIIYLQN